MINTFGSKKKEPKKKDKGEVFFFNLTHQTLDLVINDAVTEPLVVEPLQNITEHLSPVSKKSLPEQTHLEFRVSSQGIPRSNTYRPRDEAVFGITNKICYWLDKEDREFCFSEIEIDINRYGYKIDEDLMIFILNDNVILRSAIGVETLLDVMKSEHQI